MVQERTRRLLQLLNLLRGPQAYDADQLALDLKISRRTLFRDLKVLESAGVPVTYDRRDAQYRVDRAYLLPAITFSLEETLALTSVMRRSIPAAALPAPQHLTSAALKLESILPADIQAHAGSLLDQTDVLPWASSDHGSISEVLTEVQTAVSTRRKLWMRYDSYFDKQEIELRVHPYRLFFAIRGWYIIAFSEVHAQLRTFKLERILEHRLEPDRFDRLPTFSLQSHMGNAWHMIRGDQRYRVVVHFSAKVAGNVEEVLWHRTQHTRRLPDGRLMLEVVVDGIEEMSWWILGYGDQAEVIEPVELRKLIGDRARRMVEIYA